jgi:hypothetical protein
MGRYHDLTGLRFGRLVVREYVASNKHGQPQWRCVCDCGGQRVVLANALRSGLTVSCGCRRQETLTAGRLRHGLSGHSAYKTWKAMISRCYDEADKDYSGYGGRGVLVCDRWLELESFIADVGEKPRGQSLERMDNSKGYSPENCRWATPREQGANKRNNNILKIGGVEIHLADVARKFGLTETTIARRLAAGMTGDQIVSVPVRKYTRKAAP